MGQNPETRRMTSKESAELNDMKVQREHVEYENALQNVEAIAQDGIESWGEERKNEKLVELRDLAAEALSQ